MGVILRAATLFGVPAGLWLQSVDAGIAFAFFGAFTGMCIWNATERGGD